MVWRKRKLAAALDSRAILARRHRKHLAKRARFVPRSQMAAFRPGWPGYFYPRYPSWHWLQA
jgi:hypothetical protein